MIHITKEVAGEHIGVGIARGKLHSSGSNTGPMLLNIPLFVCGPMRTKNSSRLRTGKLPERIILSDSCFISKIPFTPPSCEYHVTKALFIDQWKEYFPRFNFSFNFRQKGLYRKESGTNSDKKKTWRRV